MDSEDDELRAELEAAREAVRHEIDRQLGSSGGAGDHSVLQTLQDELDQLEEALSNLAGRES